MNDPAVRPVVVHDPAVRPVVVHVPATAPVAVIDTSPFVPDPRSQEVFLTEQETSRASGTFLYKDTTCIQTDGR